MRSGRGADAPGGIAGFVTSRVARVVGLVVERRRRGEIGLLNFVHAARERPILGRSVAIDMTVARVVFKAETAEKPANDE